MHRADRRRVHLRIEACKPLPDLRSPPGRSILLQPDDQRLDLGWELIGMAIGSARAVGQPFNTATVMILEPVLREMPNSRAQRSHFLSVQRPCDELQSL